MVGWSLVSVWHLSTPEEFLASVIAPQLTPSEPETFSWELVVLWVVMAWDKAVLPGSLLGIGYSLQPGAVPTGQACGISVASAGAVRPCVGVSAHFTSLPFFPVLSLQSCTEQAFTPVSCCHNPSKLCSANSGGVGWHLSDFLGVQLGKW